ncbi:TatD family hydrolase [Treponema pectinovorum]|uniref:TatD family hydrolase n=1 Tax=Treponema pectinovorum TaxID=164 RepID=UPI0011C93877|nr:TatD family hydrolase [Treponema pectinovorum]
MFSDTHFHLYNLVTECSVDGSALLEKLVEKNTSFVLDIGTRCDDLLKRREIVEKSLEKLPLEIRSKARDMFFYSAGIWPDVESIKNRTEVMKTLKEEILSFNEISPKKLIAIGEGGIDHHWNPSGTDSRNKEEFGIKIYDGERELFENQLLLSKEMNLPTIVHSRDAFEATLECIKNVGWHKGIIHCFSYNLEQAKAFLDLGWYLAFGGGTTYTKKSKIDDMKKLLRYVPDDRILLETDSPYLAPVPFRGQTNTPLLIDYCYDFIAQARNTDAKSLSQTVEQNIKNLFNL